MLSVLTIIKLVVIIYLWVLIALSLLFILNSIKIYKILKNFEYQCIYNRQIATHSLIPVLIDLSNKNKVLRMILHPKDIDSKERLHIVCLSIFKCFNIFQNIRLIGRFFLMV